MAKRPTRAAAGAKRPAVDKKPTTKPAAGTAPSKAATSKAGKRGAEAEPVAKGRATAAAKPAKTKTRSAKAEAATAKAKPTTAEVAASARGASAGKRKPTARAAKSPAGAAAPRRKSPAKPTKVIPPYLAAELGQPVDHEGEPIGAGSRAAFADTELQRYTLQLWQQMQSRRGVNLHLPAMERAGVTIDQIWTTGVTDRLTTSSTDDEVRRYRQKLLFRANLLESILTETVSELNRLNSVEPKPSAGESG